MNNILRVNIFLIAAFLFITNKSSAQCSGCTTNITTSVTSYTAATGQTLCLSGGITYTGTITLNGGTICNSGIIKNITFLAGTFINYGTYSGGNVTMSTTGNITIENYNGSTFTMGSLAFNGAAGRPLTLNVYKGASATFTSSITQNSGTLNMEIGRSNPGGDPVLTSTLTAGSLVTIKRDDFSLLMQSKSTATISDIFSLEGTGVKSITNNGTLTLVKNLNMISSGSSTSTVTINNNNIMTMLGVNASYTSGKVFVNNNSAASMTVSGSITLSNSTNTLTNAGYINATSNFNIQAGIATNSGTMTQNSLSATGGTLTNNNMINTSTDFLITNTVAVVNNNRTIVVANTFSNIATVNTATQTMLYTKNYYNNSSTSTINGVSSATDTLTFPRIFITGTSDNSGGFLTNKLFIYDASLTSTTSTIGYGFDAVSSTTRIASTVVWGSKAVSPGNGNPAVVNCRQLASMIGATITPSPAGVICAGTPLNLTGAVGYYYYYLNPSSIPVLAISPIAGISSSSYTWNPGGVTGNPKTFTPSVSTTYTMSVTYNTCVYTTTYAVTVAANVASIAGTSPTFFALSDPINLNGNISGGTAPYNYVWTPNSYFVITYTNTTQNTQVSPPVSLVYTLTVTDFYGCIATTTITLIAKPYAPLNKSPDGEYYLLYNNKMLFVFDGQYAQTGLVYRVYDKANAIMASNSVSNIANTLVVNSGDNRYYLNAASLAPGYYTLEVVNEKKEKLYLRFKK